MYLLLMYPLFQALLMEVVETVEQFAFVSAVEWFQTDHAAKAD
jgi:hypothetical protein